MTLLSTALAALAGAFLFERLHVPAGALLGATAGVAFLNLATATTAPALPTPVRFISYAALGWLIGEGVTRGTVATLVRSTLPVVVVVGVLLGVGVALGWLLVRLGVTDPATAYLATSPGALSQMSAIGASVGADVALVATVHTVRVVAVILLAPVIDRLVRAV